MTLLREAGSAVFVHTVLHVLPSLKTQIADAIKEAEKAIAIGELVKASFGVRARYAHVLSKALLRYPERQEECEQARKEAQRLRTLLPKGRTDLSDGNDAAV